MIIDPLTTWEDGFPYTLLAEAGIASESSMAEIKDALFALMAHGMSPAQRAAWDALRFPESRLAIDFFTYRTLPGIGANDQKGSP